MTYIIPDFFKNFQSTHFRCRLERLKYIHQIWVVMFADGTSKQKCQNAFFCVPGYPKHVLYFNIFHSAIIWITKFYPL